MGASWPSSSSSKGARRMEQQPASDRGSSIVSSSRVELVGSRSPARDTLHAELSSDIPHRVASRQVASLRAVSRRRRASATMHKTHKYPTVYTFTTLFICFWLNEPNGKYTAHLGAHPLEERPAAVTHVSVVGVWERPTATHAHTRSVSSASDRVCRHKRVASSRGVGREKQPAPRPPRWPYTQRQPACLPAAAAAKRIMHHTN